MAEAWETDFSVLSIETLWVGAYSVLQDRAEGDLSNLLVDGPSSLDDSCLFLRREISFCLVSVA